MSQQSKTIYEFGPFRLDPFERLLLREGEAVLLTTKVFDVLVMLVENSGHLLERDELLRKVWADSFVEEANLTVSISALRKALGVQSDGHQYIETVPKRGYRFAIEVTKSQKEEAPTLGGHTRSNFTMERENQTQGENQPPFGGIEPTRSRHANNWVKRRLSLQILTACIALASLILVATRWWKPGSEKRAPTDATVKSIAVLPFKLLSVEEGDEFMGLGMADILITRLGSLNRINVRPMSAVYRYASSEQNFVAAGRDLKVEAIIEGGIQRLGKQIRVTARLVRVEDGSLIWANTFDGKSMGIFALQDRISEQVTTALSLNLGSEERKRLTQHYTEDAEAYQAYMKGRYFWDKRTGEGIHKGIEYFKIAIEKDPGYALPYAGLADCYTLLGDYSLIAPKEAFPKAKEAAVKAVEIDDELAECHTSLAYALLYCDWDWEGAEREFKRALELNDNYATAHHWYSEYLGAMGRFDEAIREMKRAQELDPQSLINTNQGYILSLAGRDDEAIEELKKTIEMDPNFFFAHILLGQVYAHKHMYKVAKAEWDKFGDSTPEDRKAPNEAFATSGFRGFLRKASAAGVEKSKKDYVSKVIIAANYVWLGENNMAMEWLERAYEERDANLVTIKVSSAFDNLRSDSRFASLLRRMHLSA